MVTKTADSKGRIALGKEFANATVIVERVGPTEFRITKARVISEHEAWLLDNDDARSMVHRGLRQAKDRQFSGHPPELDSGNVSTDETEG